MAEPWTPDIVVRPLCGSDSLEDLTQLLHRAYAGLAAMGLHFMASQQDSGTTARRIAGGECYVATVDAGVVGTILLRPPGTLSPKVAWYRRPDVAAIGQFGVEPELQQHGIGHRLMAHAEERARQLGATELALDTSEQALHLIELYRRWGFCEVDAVKWDEVNYRSVVMSRPIPGRAGSLSIRRYAERDRDACWDLHVKALEGTGAFFPGPVDRDFDTIEGTYLRSGGEFLVGEINGVIVAMGALRRIDAGTAAVKRMRVLPEYQRRGFGQAMLDALESRAGELGFSVLELDTTVQQVGARRLYEKNGYVQVGEQDRGAFVELRFRKERRHAAGTA